MPTCPYCGFNRYLTPCQSYLSHLETCRLHKEELVKKEMEFLKSRSATPQVINNYTMINVQINNQLYLDYPQSPLTQKVIHEAQLFDVRKLKTIDDFEAIVRSVQSMNGGEIEKYLDSNDKRATSHALSFMANLSKVLREKIERETPQNLLLIEVAHEFEKDCLDEKKTLEPIVSDI